jgi:peptidylprolyl isomerase
MKLLPVAAALLVLGLAGCAEPAGTGTTSTTSAAPPPCPSIPDTGKSPKASGIELDLITPRVWNVCSDTETMYVWVHNNSTTTKDYAWSITGPNGTALPAGWTVTFLKPSGTLAVAGSKGSSGGRPTYPDWADSRVTLKLPAGHATGNVSAELHAAGATRAFTFVVNAPQAVSGVGNTVAVHYDGRFDRTGERFQEGDFSTKLGLGQTVPGFDNGLMGLAAGETARLHLPPPFAYGYDPDPQHIQFKGEPLLFIVTANKIS